MHYIEKMIWVIIYSNLNFKKPEGSTVPLLVLRKEEKRQKKNPTNPDF